MGLLQSSSSAEFSGGNVFIPLFVTAIALLVGYFVFTKKRTIMLMVHKNIWKNIDHKSVSAALHPVLPFNTVNGWTLLGADNGKRLWLQTINSLGDKCPLFGACSIIETSPKEVISTLCDTTQQPDWDPLVSHVNVVSTPTIHDDFHYDVVKIVGTGNKGSYSLTRCWRISDSGCCWALSVYVDGDIGDVKWTYWKADPIEMEGLDGFSVVSLCIGTSVVCLKPPSCLTTWLQSLQQHVTLRQCETNHKMSAPRQTVTTIESSMETRVIECDSSNSNKVDKPTKSSAVVSSQIQSNLIVNIRQQPALDSQQQRWFELCNESAQTVLTVSCATVDDGWEFVNQTKGVTIMKKPSTSEGSSVNRVKGTAVIAAPPFFILSYINDFDKSKKWNEMFDYGEIIEQITVNTRVSRLVYKPVFPTTGRDFCLVTGVRQLGDHTFVSAVSSVKHLSCREDKKYVRAESHGSGFAIIRDAENGEKCTVTYTTHVDLKGRVPTFVVNKVASSQPLCVAVLRDLVEQDYKVLTNEEKQRWQTMTLKSYLRRGEPEKEEEAEEEEVEVSQEGSDNNDGVQMKEEMENEQVGGSGENTKALRSASESDDMNVEESLSSITLDIDLPLTSESEVDYRTLGNQMCGEIMAEFLMASTVDLQSSKKQSSGGWMFQGVEKDVLMMKKLMPDSKFDGFMGKGIIELPPAVVWAAVKDSRTRFSYDNMLKTLDIVEVIEPGLQVVYCTHEATNCFVKQARDLCYLHCEREDPSGKFVVAGRSIEHPKCPPKPNLVRAHVIASGWQIEALQQRDRTISSVSYLVQVNLGGMVPVRLLNMIAKRQPLAVAYLREYLTSS
ncbi:uncharacterized protein LOC134179815 [Corticium candelabrum]|uniref:uncharacterized protein LOC134179815 n=1 Tax=Corticium candelabrum TaxID=121492 RepID=UPI002E25ACBA|nr:uncharacterized protein LOC134179815 [Corticium candelabrum]